MDARLRGPLYTQGNNYASYIGTTMDIDPQTLRGDWNYPTAMRFGPGRISELADACGAGLLGESAFPCLKAIGRIAALRGQSRRGHEGADGRGGGEKCSEHEIDPLRLCAEQRLAHMGNGSTHLATERENLWPSAGQ